MGHITHVYLEKSLQKTFEKVEAPLKKSLKMTEQILHLSHSIRGSQINKTYEIVRTRY